MRRRQLWLAACIAISLATITSAFSAPRQTPGPGCLHGPDESGDQAGRRKQALAFARLINTQQLRVFAETKAYGALATLPISQQPPDGFAVRLSADGQGYSFSVVDTSDPCKFGYFSNHEGLIYRGQVLR